MLDNGALGFSFGSYFGLVFHASRWPCLHAAQLINETKWKPIARFGVAIGLCVPVLLLYLLGPNQIGNVYVLMFFKTFLPTLVSGFIIFGIADHVNMKLNLLAFEDLPLTSPLL